MNINQRNFDVSLINPTSVALETGRNYLDPAECLSKFMEIFTRYIEDYLSTSCEGSDRVIRQKYISHLWLVDEPAQFIDYTGLPSGHIEAPVNPIPEDSLHTGRRFSGIIRGVSPSGLLKVEDTEKGELREFAFKEIAHII